MPDALKRLLKEYRHRVKEMESMDDGRPLLVCSYRAYVLNEVSRLKAELTCRGAFGALRRSFKRG